MQVMIIHLCCEASLLNCQWLVASWCVQLLKYRLVKAMAAASGTGVVRPALTELEASFGMEWTLQVSVACLRRIGCTCRGRRLSQNHLHQRTRLCMPL